MGALVDDGGWIKSFDRIDGINARYQAGRVRGLFCCVHITAGENSLGITPRLCNGLLRHGYQGNHVQHAPLTAVTFSCCEHNTYGPGWETEKKAVGDPTDDWQIDGWAMVIASYREIGMLVAFSYHNGNHDVQPGAYPASYCSHMSLRQFACDQHSDWLPDEDMAEAYRRSLRLGAPATDDYYERMMLLAG